MRKSEPTPAPKKVEKAAEAVAEETTEAAPGGDDFDDFINGLDL
jgi:hypothetical protein